MTRSPTHLQEEYVRENIAWTPIDFFNNKIVCDLIEERRPPGIFSILNDVIATAHADAVAADKSLVQRLGSCTSHPHFELRASAFCVRHYAGDVVYEIEEMSEKNKDQLSLDLLQLLKTSSDKFLLSLFPESATMDERKKCPSASDRIKTSAGALVQTLMCTQPAYIRCIKPNENKSATEFDSKRVMHQIKYLGLLENVRVRRAGFCYRQGFQKFLERFYLLSRRTSYAGEYIWNDDARSGCQCILEDSGVHRSEWQLGTTKVFVRHPETLWALEHLRERYWHNMAIRIQRAYRNYIRYKTECVRRIQVAYRKWRSVRMFLQLRDYGHTVYQKQKERRRFSLISMRRYLGDYLNAAENTELLRVCGISNQDIMFSSDCNQLVERLMRAPKMVSLEVVIAGSSLYLTHRNTEKTGQQPSRILDRKIIASGIRGVSTSSLCDDWIALHIKDEMDLVICCPLKTEFITHLQRILHGNLQVQVINEILYSKKPGKISEIKFVAAPESAREAVVQKGYTFHVGRGQSPAAGTSHFQVSCLISNRCSIEIAAPPCTARCSTHPTGKASESEPCHIHEANESPATVHIRCQQGP